MEVARKSRPPTHLPQLVEANAPRGHRAVGTQVGTLHKGTRTTRAQ
jgi:hypothetical protein